MPDPHNGWPGLDPIEPGPQPSRPSPAFGAPPIGQRTITPSKEDPMHYDRAFADGAGDHSTNGGYGHQPLPPLPPQPTK
ncbi:hypothetical protein ACGFZP_13085 [Kitasatospora sp. NPDC048239]|uniref:hypothetical protein n=1 Tax=Kitasatospora sp. NPDC048239 TaxID=3364046 RepID=UPI0037203238